MFPEILMRFLKEKIKNKKIIIFPGNAIMAPPGR